MNNENKINIFIIWKYNIIYNIVYNIIYFNI